MLFRSSGCMKTSAREIALNILKEVDGIHNLSKLTLNKLLQIKGIGSARACNIMAAIDLSKRMQKNIPSLSNVSFTSPEVIHNYYKSFLGNHKQEHFYVVYLNSAKKIICDKLLFVGTINQSLVHPREVFKEAYLNDAVAIICIHNHPSGNVLPSREDLNLTARLAELARLFNIQLLDHIIIGSEKYYSFYENGDLN